MQQPPEKDRSMTMDNQQPMISVIIPAYNGRKTLTECLGAINSSDYPNYEVILVDDCSKDATPAIAREYGARVTSLEGGPYGPGYARNRGVEMANGEIVLFIDADVVIKSDTVTKVAETFVNKPEISALFGSYDDDPDAGDFSSQFKNLFHHFVHQQGRELAVTFWSGCGAVRKQAFMESGGFDAERYPRPSIEDIELGYRLTAAGHQIAVNKDVQVKHLKRWTLRGMIKADIFDRAIPWTQLILREKNLPNDLNLGLSQRASALLLLVLIVHLIWTAFFHNIVILLPLAAVFFVMISYWNNSEGSPPLSRISTRAEIAMYLSMGMITGLSIYLERPLMLVPVGVLFIGTLMGKRFGMFNRFFRGMLFLAMIVGIIGVFSILVVNFNVWFILPVIGLVATIIVLNIRFYAFFIRKRGFMFAFAVIPFHLLYYLYSTITFALVTGVHTWNTNIMKK